LKELLCRAVIVGFGISLGAGAFAENTKIKKDDLPAAVKKTLDEQSKGATLRGLAKETEEGKTLYEVELTVNGRNKDLLIDASGAVVEVEEQVTMQSLPAAVRTGLEKEAGAGKILIVETVTKGGNLVAYEASVETAGKKSEIKVTPEGKPTK